MSEAGMMAVVFNGIRFRDELVPDCPPARARETGDGDVVFRFVEQEPPDPVADFRSNRQMRPDAMWPEEQECRRRGLSVYASLGQARAALGRFQATDRRRLEDGEPRDQKWLDMGICRVDLARGAGAIMSASRSGHMTWWPSEDFDIAAHIRPVDRVKGQ